MGRFRQTKKYLNNTLTKDFLVKEYIDNKKSAIDISKEVNCCDDTIKNYLKKFNIKIRTKSEARKIKYWNFNIKSPKLTKDILYKEYIIKENIIRTIAKKYNISEASVFRRMKYFGISSRGYNHEGKNNPRYIDGNSNLPYPMEFNESLKELIRDRDNRKCQLCGCPEIENCRKLDIHHIDYDKENCCKENLISLCLKCNLKVNSNRKYWTNYFSGVLNGTL